MSLLRSSLDDSDTFDAGIYILSRILRNRCTLGDHAVIATGVAAPLVLSELLRPADAVMPFDYILCPAEDGFDEVSLSRNSRLPSRNDVSANQLAHPWSSIVLATTVVTPLEASTLWAMFKVLPRTVCAIVAAREISMSLVAAPLYYQHPWRFVGFISAFRGYILGPAEDRCGGDG